MSEAARVSVRILERDYQIGCPPEERAALLDSAAMLNARMREIRDGGKIVGLERIAIMAALNIANELLHARERTDGLENKAKARVKAMRERVEGALQSGQQLEL